MTSKKLKKIYTELEKLSKPSLSFIIDNANTISKVTYILHIYKNDSLTTNKIFKLFNKKFKKENITLQHLYRLLKKLEKDQKIKRNYDGQKTAYYIC